MSIMQEAIPKRDWEDMQQGKPMRIKPQIARPEPERPAIENEIKFDDIPVNDFVELEYAKRKTLKNAEGVRFIGYDVSMILNSNAPLKRKPGRPAKDEYKEELSSESKTLTGWMDEGNFMQLVRTFRKKINQQVINW